MQIFHRLRRFAAALLLVPLSVGFQPVAAAQPQRTEAANIVKVVSFSAPPTGLENVPKSVRGGLLLGSDGNIYFASSAGGTGYGGVARLVKDGTQPDNTLEIVHNFADSNEGLSSFGRLVQASDGNLYGTTYFGGDDGTGTVFKVTLAGEFTLLHTFTGGSKDPRYPYTGLVQGPDGNLYGTTLNGGDREKGTIFRISTSGTFSIVHSFNGDDGGIPEGQLIVGADGKLYGTTMQGGPQDRGVIYRITTDGQYERLYSFPGLNAFNAFGLATNSGGANPRSGLMLAANGKFYGTAYQGGAGGYGTLYSVTVANDGSVDVATVHDFTGPPFGAGFSLATPVEGPDGSLYGTSERGGYIEVGAAWKVAPDGSFTLLHSFFGGDVDGSQPYSSLLFVNGVLYGVSNSDDLGGAGSIINLIEDTGSGLPVQITAAPTEITLGESVDISWNAAGAATCDKFGSWDEPTSETDPAHITPASGTSTVFPSVGVFTYALACTDANNIVHNAYIGILVNPPVLESVDGGEIIGGGTLSWLLLALFAALLVRKLIKETRSSCP